MLSKDNGNLIGLTSTYQSTDGSTRAAADVWFVADKTASIGTAPLAVDSAIAALNTTRTPLSGPTQYARVKDSGLPARATVQAAVFNPNPCGQLAPANAISSPAVPLPDTMLSEIRTSVSNMAHAIASFDSLTVAAREQSSALPSNSPALTPPPSATTLTVASMVDVMKRFDGNGKDLFASGTGASALGKSITLPGLQDPAKNGMLASPAV
jgi:hypothetical protein